MRLTKAYPLFFLFVTFSIITLFSSPMVAFTIGIGSLTPVPQLPSNLTAITATNAQNLKVVARLYAKNADGCGIPIAWSPDSHQLAISSTAGIDLFDTRHLDKVPIHIPVQARRDERFSPDWSILAIVNHDGSVDIWNTVTAEKKFSIPLTDPNIGALKFDPTGRLLVLDSYEYQLWLWDVKTNTQVHSWSDDQYNELSLAFSPDGSMVAVTTSPTLQSRTIQLWDIKKGQPITDLNLKEFQPIISQLAFSPDSNMLVVSSNRNTTVWSAKTYKVLFVLEMNFRFDWALASVFSPDSKMLASFGRERIYLWDITWTLNILMIGFLRLAAALAK